MLSRIWRLTRSPFKKFSLFPQASLPQVSTLKSDNFLNDYMKVLHSNLQSDDIFQYSSLE